MSNAFECQCGRVPLKFCHHDIVFAFFFSIIRNDLKKFMKYVLYIVHKRKMPFSPSKHKVLPAHFSRDLDFCQILNNEHFQYSVLRRQQKRKLKPKPKSITKPQKLLFTDDLAELKLFDHHSIENTFIAYVFLLSADSNLKCYAY